MNTSEIEVLHQFDGLSNFRDVGGFRTQDGHRMKSGTLFRSDELSRLSSNDLGKLRRLNLKLICDLRTQRERKSKPDRIPYDEGVRLVNVPIYHQITDFGRLGLLWFLRRESGVLALENLIRDYYHSIALEHTVQVNEIITVISDKRNLPALVHCTGGRDRTGFIAALVQLLVGVPRKTVLDDYLITNRAYEARIKKLVRYIGWISLSQVKPERIRQVLEVRSEYLDEVLEDILEMYGTIEAYLSRACGIDQARLLNLQRLLLE